MIILNFFKKYVIVCTNFAFVNPNLANEKEIETLKEQIFMEKYNEIL